MRVAKIPDAFFEPFYRDFPLKTLPVLPADIVSVLSAGMVQASPVPAEAFLEVSDAFTPLPFCLSPRKGYAFVFGKGPSEEVELGLGRSAAGSVLYAHIVLRFSFGAKRLWLVPDARPGETSYYLAEGEEAARLSRELPVWFDVSAEWTRWSGRAPVFYVWAAIQTIEEEEVMELARALERSLAAFTAEPSSWRARRVGLDPQELLASVSYRLGREEEAGLRFLSQARSLISEG